MQNANNEFEGFSKKIGEVMFFCGKESGNASWKFAKSKNHTFFCASDNCYTDKKTNQNKLTKIYSSFKDAKDFISWFDSLDIVGIEKNFYEVIRDGYKTNLFADVEWNKEIFKKDEKEIVEIFFKYICMQFEEMGLKFDRKDFNYTNASNDKKGSFHFISNKFYFNTIEEQLKFWNQIYIKMRKDESIWYLDECPTQYLLKTFIDFSVYNKNRQFRTIYSKKMNDKGELVRPLEPEEGQSKKMKDYLITYIHQDKAQNINMEKYDDIEIVCKRKGKSYDKTVIETVLKKEGYGGFTIQNIVKNGLIVLKSNGAECPLCKKVHITQDVHSYLYFKGNDLLFRCHSPNSNNQAKKIYTFEEDKEKLEDDIPFHRYLTDYRRNVKDVKSYEEFVKRVRHSLNQYCVWITGEGKPFIAYRGTYEEEKTNKKYSKYLYKFEKIFIETYKHFKVSSYVYVKDKKGNEISVIGKEIPIVKFWIDYEKKRTFEFIDQDPTFSSNSKTFNTFEKLAISREEAYAYRETDKDKEDLELWKTFIKNCMCNKNDIYYDYFIKWIANSIQNIGNKMRTSIVLQGVQGSGKSSFVKKIVEIIGEKYFTAPTNPEYVVGNFNFALNNVLFLFLDELTWGGDIQKDGIIKKLLTEDKITLNQKNMPMITVKNRFNTFIASNEDWIVKVSDSSRRYNIFKTNNGLKDYDLETKKRIVNINAMVVAKYLYSIDLTDFNPEIILDTEGLKEHKELSMSNFQKWYMDILDRDVFEYSRTHTINSFYNAFETSNFANKNHKMSMQIFSSNLQKMYPFEKIRKRVGDSKNPIICIEYPTKEVLVDLFNRKFNSTILEISEEEEEN